MTNLIVTDASGTRAFPIKGLITIGRHPYSTIVLQDKAISKHHATICMADNHCVFEDLNSSNGSFLNGLRVSTHKLRDGDVICVGEVILKFQVASNSDDVSKLVNLEQFKESTTEYKERVDVAGSGHFVSEHEVRDINALRVDYEKLRMGHELMQSLGFERDLKVLLDGISKQLIRMFLADRCVILLVNKAGDFEAKSVQSLTTLDGPVNVSTTVLNEVQKSRSAVLLTDIKDDASDQISSIMLMGVQSVMCSPIILAGKVIGAVHIDMRHGQGSFTKKDLQLLGGIVAYVSMAVANVQLSKKIEREAKMQSQFERLLSPSVVQQLMAGKLSITQGGELRQVTIMFADIRGFTQMSQKTPPMAVLNMLNQYFERLVSIVFRYGGTVDKFIGDEIMVLFGAPISMNNQEDVAIACALDIQAMLTQWNQERVVQKKKIIPVGIGVNTGEVIVGAIGSSQTMQYTCIGNAVNVASRLTGIAKAGQVVVTKTTLERVKSVVKYSAMPPTAVKGIDSALECFVVDSITQPDSKAKKDA